MRDRMTVCGDCKVMFPKPYDRVAACPVCYRDVELPGYNVDSCENVYDCAPVRPYAAEVQ